MSSTASMREVIGGSGDGKNDDGFGDVHVFLIYVRTGLFHPINIILCSIQSSPVHTTRHARGEPGYAHKRRAVERPGVGARSVQDSAGVKSRTCVRRLTRRGTVSGVRSRIRVVRVGASRGARREEDQRL